MFRILRFWTGVVIFNVMSVLSRSNLPISAERAKNAIKSAKLTQREVARQIGIDETKLSKTLAGNRRFTAAELAAFTEVTGVAAEYLEADNETASTTVVAESSRRQNILNAAWHLFSEHGYTRVRIADIAEQAEVSSTSVLYYFKTKTALLFTCLKHAATLRGEYHTSILEGRGTAAEKLRVLALAHLPDHADSQRPWVAWLQYSGTQRIDDSVQELARSASQSWYADLTKCVETGQQNGWLADDPQLAETLTTLLDGLGLRVISGITSAEQARTILEKFLEDHLIEPHPT